MYRTWIQSLQTKNTISSDALLNAVFPRRRLHCAQLSISCCRTAQTVILFLSSETRKHVTVSEIFKPNEIARTNRVHVKREWPIAHATPSQFVHYARFASAVWKIGQRFRDLTVRSNGLTPRQGALPLAPDVRCVNTNKKLPVVDHWPHSNVPTSKG